MGLFKNLEGKKDRYLRLGTWKMLRKGLYVRFDYVNKRYLLKKHEVIHHLTEEDCDAIVKDLMGGEGDDERSVD